MRSKVIAIAAIVLVAALSFLIMQKRLAAVTAERDKYKQNSEALLTDVETYRVKDSLSGAKVLALELTVKEYERFRAEDAALIKSLKAKNRDLAAVNKTQSETIIELSSIAKDTVIIIRDSIQVPAVAIHSGDYWYDFDGILAEGQFTGTLHNRDSLVLAETVRYKRWLFFKTRKIKDRQLDVISANPHTEIIGLEHIVIEKK